MTAGRRDSDRPQPHLPRFGDPRDVDEFVEKLEAFERGELSSDDFRSFRLLRGVYGQRQEGFQMLRTKIPGGVLSSDQCETLARVAERSGRGVAHVTTRQNIQFHFVRMADVEGEMRELVESGLTTREACGHSVRTITACETGGACPGGAFDVTPHALALTSAFLGHPRASTLPRKFKMALSCSHVDCARAFIHDVGFVAKLDESGARGFRVVVGGGLSNSPRSAFELEAFVPETAIARVAHAIVLVFHEQGNRDNRHRARLKYLIRKLGEEGFRAAYLDALERLDQEAKAEIAIAVRSETRVGPSDASDAPSKSPSLSWLDRAVVRAPDGSHAIVYAKLPLGDASPAQMRAIADIARTHGTGIVRLTIDQNIAVSGIHPSRLPHVYAALERVDLASEAIRSARDVTSCPGAETCNLAVTASRRLADRLGAFLEGRDDLTRTLGDAIIKISGCPNGCGQHQVADIGFHGGAKRDGQATVPVYQLAIGGGTDERGARFARPVAKIPVRLAEAAIERLVGLYEARAKPGESPSAYFARLSLADAREAVSDLTQIDLSRDVSDLGETSGFVVDTKDGECAA